MHPVQAMDRNRHPSPIGGNATFMGFGVAAPMPSYQLPRCVQATPSFRHLVPPAPRMELADACRLSRCNSIAMKRLDIAFHGGHNGRFVDLTQPFRTPDIETGYYVDAVVKAVGEPEFSDVPSVSNAVGRVVTLAGERRERDEHESKKLHARRGTVGETAAVGMKDRDGGMVAAEVADTADEHTLQGFVAVDTEVDARWSAPTSMVPARVYLDRIRPSSTPSKNTWMDRIAPMASSRSRQTSSADATVRITRCQSSIFTDTSAYRCEFKAPPSSWNRSTPGRCRTSTSRCPKVPFREWGSGTFVALATRGTAASEMSEQRKESKLPSAQPQPVELDERPDTATEYLGKILHCR